MKRPFSLNQTEVILIFLMLGAFIYSGALVIKQHYLIVYNAYTFSRLQDRVNRAQDVLKNLKVERSQIITPEYLEQAAGRGGYLQPTQEQFILLNELHTPR